MWEWDGKVRGSDLKKGSFVLGPLVGLSVCVSVCPCDKKCIQETKTEPPPLPNETGTSPILKI